MQPMFESQQTRFMNQNIVSFQHPAPVPITQESSPRSRIHVETCAPKHQYLSEIDGINCNNIDISWIFIKKLSTTMYKRH